MRVRWCIILLVCIAAARVAVAQSLSAPGRAVSGVVHDSIARKPLAGALVQLVALDSLARFGQTVASDSQGRFAFNDVPDGRYTLGFFHPMLDSLGLEPVARAVSVDNQRAVQADLAIPSAARLRVAICGPPSAENSGAVVMGIVRDARDRSPSAGIRVIGEWLEISIGRGGVVRRNPRRVTTTRESGWFALCNVPGPGSVTLMASRGADSTDFIEVQVPAEGFLRRELYLGGARTVIAGDSARRGDTVAVSPRRMHVGEGRLSGTVVAVNGDRPLAGAQIGIVNGPLTRANARGEWTLVEAPAGTRTLEVRAVGYYPARQTVDVVEGAAPVHVALVTFKSVLDTMKVIANYDRFSNLAGYRERSRSGLGRFFSGADIARRQLIVTSDLFRNMPGVYLDGGSDLDQSIYMRGIFEDRCVPSIFLNGSPMVGITAATIDAFVKPAEVVGIEVYSQSQAPPQFQLGLSGCGSIVIWTR